VQKGQFIATVDATIYREQYEARLAQAKLAEDTCCRVNEMYQQGSIARTEFTTAVEARSLQTRLKRAA
jgi:membrane fusion protein (multidrug efflux system)